MYNVLITSDFHIHEYKNYNPTPYFRLEQFNKLAEMMIKTAKEKDCKEIWFCGDLLGVANETPRVMNTLKNILNNFTENNLTVRIALGNHDVLVRTNETDIEEYDNYTLVSLLSDNKNIHVYNSEVVDVNSKRVLFQSWVPSNKFETKEADYLIAHGDFNKKLSPFVDENSFIDASSYTRAFIGHIHIPKEIDNVISPGTPLMHSYSDYPETSYIVFDVDNNTYERVPTTDNFLKFVYVDTEEDAFKLEESLQDNQHAVIRVKPKKKDELSLVDIDSKEVDLSDLDIDPKNVLAQYTDTLSDSAKNILNKVISNSNTADIQTPDLRVEFLNLEAKNFLSIKDINFDFTKYHGLVCICGHVGAGKSTLFNLVQFMLYGKLPNRSKSDYTAFNKDAFEGVLELKYKEHLYKIKRTLSSLELYKDDKPLESNRKNDVQKTLEDELSFMKFMNLIYIHQGSTGIFADMSDTSRVSFLSNLIGLDLIKIWTDNLANAIKDQQESVKDINTEVIKLETENSENNKYIEDNQEHNKFIDNKDILEKIKSYEEVICAYNQTKKSLNDNINQEKNNISLVDANILKANNLFKAHKDKLSLISQKRNLKNSNLTKISSLETELSNLGDLEEVPDTNELLSKLKSTNDDIVKIETAKSLVNSKLEHFLNHPSECPTCKQKWIIADLDQQVNTLKSKLAQIDNLASTKTTEKTNLETSISNCQDIVNRNSKRNSLKTEINSLISNNNLIDDNIKELEKSSNEILDDLNNYAVLENDTITEYKNSDKSIYEKNITDLTNKIIEIDANISAQQNNINTCNQVLGTIKINNEIYNRLVEYNTKIETNNKSLEELYSTIKDANDVIDELTAFNKKILSDKGMLVASLLAKVAEYLNTDKMLKVETIQELNNGNLKPTLNIKLRVDNLKKDGKSQYVDYAFLSGGQRLQADLRFLCGITQTLGSISIMFLDELFKFFNEDAILEGAEILKSMNIDKVFLVLHGSNGENISNNVIHVRLDENLGSVYE